jgi:hypothetical protein
MPSALPDGTLKDRVARLAGIRALPDAVREGLITSNPAALVKLAPAKRPKGLVWTADRVDRW